MFVICLHDAISVARIIAIVRRAQKIWTIYLSGETGSGILLLLHNAFKKLKRCHVLLSDISVVSHFEQALRLIGRQFISEKNDINASISDGCGLDLIEDGCSQQI